MQTYQPDHYRVLGVSPRADIKSLKQSYRTLSRVYHPDHQADSAMATSRFQLISAAYSTLSDAVERERYDRLLMLTDPLRFVEDPRADRALAVLDVVVSRLRTRRARLPDQSRGRHVRVQAEVSFRTAALGGEIEVAVQHMARCHACEGAGTTEPERCPVCHVCSGDGRVKVGVRRATRTCGFCDGKGEVMLAPCDDCDGHGEVTATVQEKVLLRPRCRPGTVVRVRHRGERASSGRDPGDLLVELSVRKDSIFSAEGDDLIVRLPLTWSESYLGTVLDVPTLYGARRLRVPARTPTGREIRIKGAGLKRMGGGHGDLRYRVEIDSPTELTDRQLTQLQELELDVGAARFHQRGAFEQRVSELQAEADVIPRSWQASEDSQ